LSKALIIGDGHFKATRLDLVVQFIDWLDKTILEVNPDFIVYLGDFFHQHSIIKCEIMSLFDSHIRRNAQYQKYYILGNHDQFKPNDSKYHALQTMKGVHPHFIVVDEILDVDDITMVPFIHDISKFPRKSHNIMFAHQTFIGADYGYTKADAGVDAATVPAEIIISGHVHKRQSFGNVIYPGSSYAQSVNDIDQSKGVMVFNTETYKYSYIETTLPLWRSMKFELGPDYNTKDMHADLVAKVDSKNHWVIDIGGPKAEVVAYLDSKQFSAFKKDKHIRTRANYTDTQKEQIKIQAVTVDDIISSYVQKVYSGMLDKQTIINKALEIKKKALL